MMITTIPAVEELSNLVLESGAFPIRMTVGDVVYSGFPKVPFPKRNKVSFSKRNKQTKSYADFYSDLKFTSPDLVFEYRSELESYIETLPNSVRCAMGNMAYNIKEITKEEQLSGLTDKIYSNVGN